MKVWRVFLLVCMIAGFSMKSLAAPADLHMKRFCQPNQSVHTFHDVKQDKKFSLRLVLPQKKNCQVSDQQKKLAHWQASIDYENLSIAIPDKCSQYLKPKFYKILGQYHNDEIILYMEGPSTMDDLTIGIDIYVKKGVFVNCMLLCGGTGCIYD